MPVQFFYRCKGRCRLMIFQFLDLTSFFWNSCFRKSQIYFLTLLRQFYNVDKIIQVCLPDLQSLESQWRNLGDSASIWICWRYPQGLIFVILWSQYYDIFYRCFGLWLFCFYPIFCLRFFFSGFYSFFFLIWVPCGGAYVFFLMICHFYYFDIFCFLNISPQFLQYTGLLCDWSNFKFIISNLNSFKHRFSQSIKIFLA